MELHLLIGFGGCGFNKEAEPLSSDPTFLHYSSSKLLHRAAIMLSEWKPPSLWGPKKA